MDVIKMEKEKVKEYIILIVVIDMKVILSKMKEMGKEYIILIMVIYIKENLKMKDQKEKE